MTTKMTDYPHLYECPSCHQLSQGGERCGPPDADGIPPTRCPHCGKCVSSGDWLEYEDDERTRRLDRE